MKATIAVLCLLVAVAYAIVVDARIVSGPIDDGALNPRCEKPENCPGNDRTVSYYDRKKGCQLIKLGANCTDNGNYQTVDECKKHCLPPPGKRTRLA
uniref:Putative tick kunitz 59 n=1 Tax=Ixodes ricinus TaxID=34613 RepID=V5ID57_IXORI